MTKDQKGRVSDETFDEFLADQGMLEECDDQALREINAAETAETMQTQGVTMALSQGSA